MGNIEQNLVRKSLTVTMTLSKLLDGVRVTKMFQTMYGQMVLTHDVEISHIRYDSRLVGYGDIFVAIPGTRSDGHCYIDMAINNGAKVVVMEDNAVLPDSYFMHTGVVKVVVPNSRVALAQVSANYYRHPAKQLTVVGITGTNGKTTTATLVKAVLESDGSLAGLIGTIDYVIGNEKYMATHTTPESLELNELLGRMVEHNCRSVAMEVSSHALHQHRVEGIDFKVAVFTNLTQDHLDYHNTMEEYFTAKAILFRELSSSSWAVVNLDDPYGHRLLGETRAKTLTYAISGQADVVAGSMSLSMRGTKVEILHRGERTVIDSPLIGRFNVSNILAAFGAGVALGLEKGSIQKAVQNVARVNGRFEPILSRQGWTVIIDYAHTPDALQKTLTAISDISEGKAGGKIITVFGCGGNRDRTKRPKMGRIATELSDITIITSDNPRNEDPEQIIRETAAGTMPNRTTITEVDRERAIVEALGRAHPGDVVLIAGKGHEDYQIVGDRKIHFSDREVVERFLLRQV
jgi:UDP-N-acetylmuramoyl-L-alanyl-D-glutamate--2,6-diaminopimelate ligase